MGQHMRHDSYSHGTLQILRMLTAEKNAEIEKRRQFVYHLVPKSRPSEDSKEDIMEILDNQSAKIFFLVIIMQLLHPLSPFLQYSCKTVFT
jgi:hypothetical protein